MTKIQSVSVFALVAVLGIFSLCHAATINDMLTNPALVQAELRCVLDLGPCDALGTSLKSLLPEVIGNNCARCNMQQRANSRLVVAFVQRNYPAEWQQIVQKYQSNASRGRF